MPAKNKFYAAFYSKQDHDRYFTSLMNEWLKQNFDPLRQKAYNNGLDNGTAYGIDMAILALGRMGIMTPDISTDLMLKIKEASEDYGKLFDFDKQENNDDEYWWSTEKMDKEIHEYTGDAYPPYTERYKKCV